MDTVANKLRTSGCMTGEYLLGCYREVHEHAAGILDTLVDTEHSTTIDRRWKSPVTAGARLISILNATTKHLGQTEFLHGNYVDQAG